MAHDHAHHHGDTNSYYLEQLFTIAVCGALGAVMVMLYATDRIGKLLVAEQHTRVLLGGVGLLAVALLRAIYVWFAVGAKQPAAHTHDHAHGACDHDHGACEHDHHEHEHGVKAGTSSALATLPLAGASNLAPTEHTHDHDNDHDHGHDHGWAPWRFMLLMLPVILFLLGLPNEGLHGKEVQYNPHEMDGIERKDKGDKVVPLSFLELEKASMNVNVRDDLAGRPINVTGKYLGNDPAHFTLVRFKINCCAADAIQLNAIILVNPADQKKFKLDPAQYNGQWVSVTGRVYFIPQSNGEYHTVVILEPSDDKPLSKLVEKLDRPSNEYAS